MAKLLVFILIFAEFIIWLAGAVRNLFRKERRRSRQELLADRYGFCLRCGKKAYLHTFEGKGYCAQCCAKAKVGKEDNVTLG